MLLQTYNICILMKRICILMGVLADQPVIEIYMAREKECVQGNRHYPTCCTPVKWIIVNISCDSWTEQL